MKSPFADANATLHIEQQMAEFRKETFTYMHLNYVCDATGLAFTTQQLDEVNLAQVHNQYRIAHNIPFADEIQNLRARYGLSAAKMSAILGLGANQYRLYEMGEMPSVSNGRLLRSIENPAVFMEMLDDETRSKIKLANTKPAFKNCLRGKDNGFAPQSYERLKNILLYLAEQVEATYITKMNKLLFYVDFLNYNHTGMAMTGLAYRALPYGIVPDNFLGVFGSYHDEIEPVDAPTAQHDGIILRPKMQADLSMFSEQEKETLRLVVARFKDTKPSEISEINHQEDAWLQFKGTQKPVDFDMAFSLKAI